VKGSEMNEREVREAKERRSAARAFRRQQEAEAESEARRGADALLEEVVEVNGEGQSKLARVRDRETNATALVEMVEEIIEETPNSTLSLEGVSAMAADAGAAPGLIRGKLIRGGYHPLN
jgi:hypothetical protein